PIRDSNELKLRDSLDRILETLTLLEIAIEAGYLSISGFRTPTRRILIDLLWSAGVRQFVLSYGFISVPLLSARLDLDFCFPPAPDLPKFEKAEMRFATFLAEHQRW